MPPRDEPTSDRDPQQIIDEQARRIAELEADLRRSEAERQRLRRENDKLKDELEAARRAVYRQAAPFSRGTRVASPRPPGRRAGAGYGRQGQRRPPPDVDVTYDAPLPAACPHCAGPVRLERVASQFQEDLPVQRPLVRRFAVHIGRCTRCRRRVQGRHPLQTSDALGAAAVQLGPQVTADAVLLNKRYGLPYGKIAALLRDRGQLTVTRGGLVHAIHRSARRARPTYDTLRATVRGSPVVTIDETSWKVDAQLQWLWTWVTDDTTVYAILPGRGLAQAASVIGLDYPGVLQHDGWHSYRYFTAAAHQTCLAHLLRRCRTLLLDHPPQRFVVAVKRILQAALATRDRYHAGRVSAHGLAVARGQYAERLGRLLERPVRAGRPIQLLQQHLVTEYAGLFSFLWEPTLDATNWRAEQALRPAVVTRKMCGGGNRTARGAQSQQILASVLRTAAQRDLDASALLG
ncbi:MAG TPA: IS66 family transposase, partial [Burkholderiales bacterium]|nr:IS66 family transposase [Burkholderiales bacterium]